MKRSLLLLPLLALSACTTNAPKDPGIQPSAYYSIEPTTSLDSVQIPVLKSAALEKRWGKPEIIVRPNGGYLLSYSKPGDSFETLRIFGEPGRIDTESPTPPTYTDIGPPAPGSSSPRMIEHTQEWSTVTLLGRPVHYYLRSPGGGADAPEWSTVTFSRGELGPSASYRILTTSNQEEGEKIAEGYMKTVGF